MDNNRNSHNQPDDNLSPTEKAKQAYGLEIAEYIIFNQNNGLQVFYNAKESYSIWRKYAMGMQSKEKYLPTIRIDPKSADKTHLLNIRQDIKNYATNAINIVVAKMDSLKYDPVVDPIDPLALDKKKDYKAKVEAYIENQQFLQSIGVLGDASGIKPDIPDELMPSNVSELEIYMQLNYKLEEAMRLELDLSKILSKNKFSTLIDRLLEKDLAVLGVGCIYTGLDQNNEVTIEYVDPADLMLPFSKTGDFSNVKYIAQRKWMTMSDIRALNRTLSDTELDEIEKNHATTSRVSTSFLNDDHHFGASHLEQQDTLKIEVLTYEYRTTNTMNFLKKKDKGGNMRMHEKDFSYYGTKSKQEAFAKKYGDERKLIRKTHQAIYSGHYIVGTKYVMNHGLKNNIETPNGPFGATAFGFKVFAPNYYNGKIVSLIGQMIPVLDQLQEYTLKISENLATPFPDGLAIDLFALRKAANTFKWKGKSMDEQAIIEMAYQSKVLLFDSSEGKYAAGSNYKPFHKLGEGQGEISKYLQLMNQALMELERITGLNQITMAGSLPKEAGKGVTEMQQQASEVALDYLYDAKKYIYGEVYKSCGTLHLQAKKFGGTKNDLDRNITKHTYDFTAEARPTDYQWREFYQDIAQQRANGLITAADFAMVKQITNLKQAYAYLAVAEMKRQKQESAMKMQDVQANAQAQQQSNEQANANIMNQIQAKNQGEMGLKQMDIDFENVKHKNAKELLTLEQMLKAQSREAEQSREAMYESKLEEEKEEEQRQTKLMVEEKKGNNAEKIAEKKPKPTSK